MVVNVSIDERYSFVIFGILDQNRTHRSKIFNILFTLDILFVVGIAPCFLAQDQFWREWHKGRME